MQLLGALVLSGLLCSCFSLEEENFETEQFTENGKNIMIIRDKETGKLVTEIDVFEKRDYQLVKPEDEDICFVVGYFIKTSKMPDRSLCFKRIRASEDMLERLDIDLSACEDREVVFLKPTGCQGYDFKGEPEQGLRQKRACYTRTEIIKVCIEYRVVCVQRGWWNCTKEETRCVKDDVRVVRTRECD